jgi:lysozyme
MLAGTAPWAAPPSRFGATPLSDTTKPTKISREGVILIKSFEGFRPRAIQRADGRWTIGYGHTQSAREGLTVSESDAELLLQYDLIPVAQAVKTIQAPLNQYQFDALSSFAFSVGVDRFKTSDVLARLNAGAPQEAADALMTWVEDPDVVTPPRRRAAERALFVADPAGPVSLADLLAAPLPPPRATLVESTPSLEPSAQTEPFEPVEPEPFPALSSHPVPAADPEPEAQAFASAQILSFSAAQPMTREAAVAALLGEVEPEVPTGDEPEVAADVAVEATAAPTQEVAAEAELADLELVPEQVSEAPVEPVLEPTPEGPITLPPHETSEAAAIAPSPQPQPTGLSTAAAFYSPYAVRTLGPLVGFGVRPALVRPTPPVPAEGEAESADAKIESSEAPAEAPAEDHPAALQEAEPPTADAPAAFQAEPSEASSEDADLDPSPVVEPAPTETTQTETAFQLEPESADQVSKPAIVTPAFAHASPLPAFQPSAMPLTLTGAPDLQASSPDTRLVWPEHADFSNPDQTPLFESEATSADGQALDVAPSAEPAPSRRFEWSETLTFLVMGVIGLLSFGASMAAFRQASRSNGEPAFIGWVLAVIALACVGVSGYNLYRRWGLADRA